MPPSGLVDHDLGFVHQVLTYARRQADADGPCNKAGTNYAENLLYVLRYGRKVLDPEIYPLVLHSQVRRYAAFNSSNSCVLHDSWIPTSSISIGAP